MQLTGLSLVLASCTTAPSAALDPTTAHELAEAIASTLRPTGSDGELAVMLDAAALARGEPPADLAREPDGTVTGQRSGFALRYVTTCRDGHGRTIACGASTAIADVDATWAAVLATGTYVAVTSREGTWILDDLTPARMRLCGESHFEYAGRVVEHGAPQTLAYDASSRDVVVFHGERWPRAGLVRYELSRDGADVPAVSARGELRFHASGRATIEVAEHAFELDLATGLVRGAP